MRVRVKVNESIEKRRLVMPFKRRRRTSSSNDNTLDDGADGEIFHDIH